MPAEALTRLGLVFGPGIFLVLLVGVWWFRGYELSRVRHRQVLDELARDA